MTAPHLAVFIVSPVMLVLSRTLLSPLSGASAVACLLAIYGMYQSSGFIFIRPLAVLLGLAQAVVGAVWFVSWAYR